MTANKARVFLAAATVVAFLSVRCSPVEPPAVPPPKPTPTAPAAPAPTPTPGATARTGSAPTTAQTPTAPQVPPPPPPVIAPPSFVAPTPTPGATARTGSEPILVPMPAPTPTAVLVPPPLPIYPPPVVVAPADDARRAHEAAAAEARLYGAAMDEARAAVKDADRWNALPLDQRPTADWQRALGAYQRADAVDPTEESKAGVDLAKKKLAEAAAAVDKKREYDRLRAEGRAYAKALNWQKAVESYKKAAAIEDSSEIQVDIAAAQGQLAASEIDAELKKRYDEALAAGAAAAKEGQWQKALDAYERARGLRDTPEVQAGIKLAREKLAEAAAAAKAAKAEEAKPKPAPEPAKNAPPEKVKPMAAAADTAAKSKPAAAFDHIIFEVTGGFAGFQQKTTFAADGKFQVRDAKPVRQADSQLTDAEKADLAARIAAVDWKAVKPSYRNPQVADSMDRQVTVVIGDTTHKTVVGDGLTEKPPAALAALVNYLGELVRSHRAEKK